MSQCLDSKYFKQSGSEGKCPKGFPPPRQTCQSSASCESIGAAKPVPASPSLQLRLLSPQVRQTRQPPLALTPCGTLREIPTINDDQSDHLFEHFQLWKLLAAGPVFVGCPADGKQGSLFSALPNGTISYVFFFEVLPPFRLFHPKHGSNFEHKTTATATTAQK